MYNTDGQDDSFFPDYLGEESYERPPPPIILSRRSRGFMEYDRRQVMPEGESEAGGMAGREREEKYQFFRCGTSSSVSAA